MSDCLSATFPALGQHLKKLRLAELPTPVEHAEFAEVRYENGRIEGATKRTANESSRGLWRHIDGLIHRCDFCDRDTAVNCI